MSKIKGKPSQMSHSKHRLLGRNGKSPKLRHLMKIEAERNSVKAKPSTCTQSIQDLLGIEHKR